MAASNRRERVDLRNLEEASVSVTDDLSFVLAGGRSVNVSVGESFSRASGKLGDIVGIVERDQFGGDGLAGAFAARGIRDDGDEGVE